VFEEMQRIETGFTKAEWVYTEKPLSESALRVLHVLVDPSTQKASLTTLCAFLKLPAKPEIHHFLYCEYLGGKQTVEIKLNNADKIRLQTKKQLPPTVYEVVVLKALKIKDLIVRYYVLKHLRSLYLTEEANPHLMLEVEEAMRGAPPECPTLHAPTVLAHPFFEIVDVKRKPHQERIIEFVQTNPAPSLALYGATMGEGKTLTPVAFSADHGIFVCGAREPALAFSRACVNLGVPMAVAFGCADEAGVRVHFNAAIKDKTGRVDNSNSEKVRWTVCDLFSFQVAAAYMKAKPNLVIVLDELFFGTNEPEHPVHALLQSFWRHVLAVPSRVILMSATLREHDLEPALVQYKAVYPQAQILYVGSDACLASATQIATKENALVLPHGCEGADLKGNPHLLRYVNLQTAAEYATCSFVNPTPAAVKGAYAEVPNGAPTCPTLDGCMLFTQKDARVFETGPCLYMTSNTAVVCRYCLESASIPPQMLSTLRANLAHNQKILAEVAVKTKQMEDKNRADEKKEKKMAEGRDKPEVKLLKEEIKRLTAALKPVNLPESYIPNTEAHKRRFGNTAGFCSNIDADAAATVLAIEGLPDNYSILFLMGIGVMSHAHPQYLALVKSMLDENRLFMVVADQDFLWGTNFDFRYMIVAADLCANGVHKLTPDMLQQMLGRVGRNGQNATVYSRIPNIGQLLFCPPAFKAEQTKLNQLLLESTAC
jgi:hypothetical protein